MSSLQDSYNSLKKRLVKAIGECASCNNSVSSIVYLCQYHYGQVEMLDLLEEGLEDE